ncbi:MAG TPA: hypothetical protein VFA00_14970, partial [Actinomycetota bacterium]|nr:hypothetical protein [Actinomycetota bacterium]
IGGRRMKHQRQPSPVVELLTGPLPWAVTVASITSSFRIWGASLYDVLENRRMHPGIPALPRGAEMARQSVS